MSAITPRSPRAASVVCALLLLAPGLSRAADTDTYLELQDGSIISGELLGIDAAGFQIRSPSLGIVDVPQGQVRVMRRGPLPDGTGAAPGNSVGPGDVQAMQQRLTGDQALMGQVMLLQNDPQVAALLADPDLLRAIAAGDLNVLRDDPRLEALSRHPGIRAIIEQLQGP